MTSPTQETQYIGLRDGLTLFYKHKKKILSVFLGTVLIATLVSFLLPPTYQSESTLLVKMGREHVYRSEVGTDTPTAAFDQERIIESEVQILTSQDLTKRVIKHLGIEAVYPVYLSDPPKKIPPLEASIQTMQENLNTEVVKDSNVIKVSFQHEVPEVAANVINLLVDFLLEKHLEIFSNPQASFLEKQALSYKQQLNNSNARLQDFKQKHRLSSLIDEQRMLLEQRRDLDTSHKEIQNQEQGLVSKVSALKSQISHVTELIPIESVSERQKVIDEGKGNLLQLRIKEQQLSTRYSDSSRPVQDIREELSLVQSFIDEQEAQLTDKVTTGKNPVYQELEIELHKTDSELSSAKTRGEEMQRQLVQLDKKLVRLDELESELETLQLKTEADQANYKMYLAKLEEATVSEEMDRQKLANISVIQPGSVPTKPIKPKKALNILIGMIVGAFGGLTLAFVWEFIGGGYTRPEHLAKDLELPILTNITYKS